LTRDCLWLHKGRHLLHAAQVALQMITFMLIGVLFHYHHQKLVSAPRALLVGAALLACFALQWWAGHQSTGAPLGGLNYCYALALFWGLFLRRDRLGPSPVLGWLVDVSYPLSLLHGFLGYAFLTVFLRWWDHPYLALALCLALVLALSWLLHRLVEVPSTAAGKRFAAWLAGTPRPDAQPAPLAAKAA